MKAPTKTVAKTAPPKKDPTKGAKAPSDSESSGEADEDEEIGPECTRCQGATAVFDELRTKNESDMSIDDDSYMFISWKVSDCKEVDFLACGDCKLFRVLCKKCNEPCSFLGHMGFKIDGTQWERAGTASSEKKLPNNAKILDKTRPRYDISDQGKTNFNVSEWYPCGPDEDMYHFWNCPNCGSDFKFSRV